MSNNEPIAVVPLIPYRCHTPEETIRIEAHSRYLRERFHDGSQFPAKDVEFRKSTVPLASRLARAIEKEGFVLGKVGCFNDGMLSGPYTQGRLIYQRGLEIGDEVEDIQSRRIGEMIYFSEGCFESEPVGVNYDFSLGVEHVCEVIRLEEFLKQRRFAYEGAMTLDSLDEMMAAGRIEKGDLDRRYAAMCTLNLHLRGK